MSRVVSSVMCNVHQSGKIRLHCGRAAHNWLGPHSPPVRPVPASCGHALATAREQERVTYDTTLFHAMHSVCKYMLDTLWS
jgi:hypothetical protein